MCKAEQDQKPLDITVTAQQPPHFKPELYFFLQCAVSLEGFILNHEI